MHKYSRIFWEDWKGINGQSWTRTAVNLALQAIQSVQGSLHYNDVIMSAMASQITGVLIVYSTVCLGVDQRKHQSSASLAFEQEIHQWPVNSQRASNAENVSIWWRHHGTRLRHVAWCPLLGGYPNTLSSINKCTHKIMRYNYPSIPKHQCIWSWCMDRSI